MAPVCAKCGEFISSGAGAACVASAVLFRSHLLLFIFNAFCYMPSEWRFGCRPHCNLLSLFVSGVRLCAPERALRGVHRRARTGNECRTAALPRTPRAHPRTSAHSRAFHAHSALTPTHCRFVVVLRVIAPHSSETTLIVITTHAISY